MKRICKHCNSKIKIKFNKLPDYGDLMTIEVFLKEVDDKTLINFDGTGRYAFKNKESNYRFDFDEYNIFNNYDKRFTHIMWFNR